MPNMTRALKRLTGASIARIANATGLPQSTLNRQAGKNDIPVADLLTICRTYKLSLIDLLQAAEFITAAEARHMRGATGLEAYTDLELAEAVYDRQLRKTRARERANLSVATPTVLTEDDVTNDWDLAADQHKPGDEPDYDNY